MKTKRQAMTVSIKELRDLADDLESQCRQFNLEIDAIYNEKTKFQINIINKKGLSDTWEIEK